MRNLLVTEMVTSEKYSVSSLLKFSKIVIYFPSQPFILHKLFLNLLFYWVIVGRETIKVTLQFHLGSILIFQGKGS